MKTLFKYICCLVIAGIVVEIIMTSLDKSLKRLPHSSVTYISRGPRFYQAAIWDTTTSLPISHKTIQYFLKVYGYNVFMFSAIGTRQRSYDTDGANSYTNNITDHVIIPSWEHKTVTKPITRCCFMHRNWSLTNTLSLINPNKDYAMVALGIKAYICPLQSPPSDIYGITITINTTMCPGGAASYLRPFFPKLESSSSIAICSKVAYGSPKLLSLIEWFEMQRFLGVDKVLVHLHLADINNEAIKVFKYYEEIDLAWIIPFDIPMTDTEPRTLEDKTRQAWADGRLCIRDCELRLGGFKYMAVLDKDEIILPKTTLERDVLKKFLEAELGSNSEVAGITIKSQLHLTSWKEMDSNHHQYFANYKQCSVATFDRVKPVVVLDRVEPLTLSSHTYKQRAGYKKAKANAEKVTLHHYRSPRESYNGVHGPLEPLGQCERMVTLTNIIRDEVNRVINHLNITLE